MSALEFEETMTGSYRAAGGDERPMSFTIRARSGPLLSFLRRPITEIDGEVDAVGFADHRRLRGTLELDLIRSGKLRYAFEFQANDGQPYAFKGEKTVSAGAFVESMTVLPGEIVALESTEKVADALLRFDIRSDMIRFVRSFRV